MRVGSLFAGIGGFDLGLERAGMRTLWQVEQEPFRRAVLARHFPDAERFEDVREVGAHNLAEVDLICGGFPCTDISNAGKRAGLDGEQSGLWREFRRILGELRPRYAVVENVTALLVRGMGDFLGDLASLGFDAEWTCVRASELGAPHGRDRIWIVAYPAGSDGAPRNLLESRPGGGPPIAVGGFPSLAMAPGWQPRGFWSTAEPPTPYLVDGFPGAVAQVEALGDALVPQIAEWIGRRILDYETAEQKAAA